MAKRRAEGPLLLHDHPPKRWCRAPCGAEPRPGSVGPPSLLALLGRSSRKRPHYFEEMQPHDEALHPEAGTHASAPASFPEPRSSCSPAAVCAKKRPREHCATPGTGSPGDNADQDASAYNSFQYWRIPLPELDLSLLEGDSQAGTRPKAKEPSSEAMET